MPPSASSKRPARAAAAPVKAPRSWPKSSLSSRASGSAPQFTATKGAPGPRPLVVDGAGHHLLARAALAAEQHRGPALRHPVHHVEDAAPRGAPADGPGEAVAAGQERRGVVARTGQGILGAVQPHPGGQHRGDGGEHAQVGVEGEGAGRPAALGGQHTQRGSDLAERDGVEGPRVVRHAAPAPGPVEEGRLVGEVGDGHRQAGVEDPADDPLPGAQPAQDALLVGHLRRRLDEDLAGHRVEERDGAVLQPQVRSQDLEHRGEGLGQVGRQHEELPDVVERLDGDGCAPGVHGGRGSNLGANPRSTGLAKDACPGPIGDDRPARLPAFPAGRHEACLPGGQGWD